ncbi:MAG: hypothetical protein J6V44_12660 [Methanobrevibacter sp.]|nr:hypothetical protein [Methanobrevibacter sp.]
MTEFIFKGKFENSNPDLFIEKFNVFLQETQTKFEGQIMRFDIQDFDDYEEIVEDEEKTNSDTNI